MIAQYNEDDKDEYLSHRIVQAFELSEFIKLTSETCDAVILCGDFNLKPNSIGYHLIRSNANLQDAWNVSLLIYRYNNEA